MNLSWFLRAFRVLRGEFVISTVVEKSLSVSMLTCMTERCFDYAQHDKKTLRNSALSAVYSTLCLGVFVVSIVIYIS